MVPRLIVKRRLCFFELISSRCHESSRGSNKRVKIVTLRINARECRAQVTRDGGHRDVPQKADP
jgi:hypothetical protein